jgi:hypothetical protein
MERRNLPAQSAERLRDGLTNVPKGDHKFPMIRKAVDKPRKVINTFSEKRFWAPGPGAIQARVTGEDLPSPCHVVSR